MIGGKSMAKKKAASGAAKPGSGGQLPEDTQRLHRFFHGLYADPDKADQFNGGPKARSKLLEASDLSDAHKKLIKRGCIPDVIHALVGAPKLAATMMFAIDCQDGIACKHPECNALQAAAAGRMAKKPAAKSGPAKKK
jgi:hypothetical protein